MASAHLSARKAVRKQGGGTREDDTLHVVLQVRFSANSQKKTVLLLLLPGSLAPRVLCAVYDAADVRCNSTGVYVQKRTMADGYKYFERPFIQPRHEDHARAKPDRGPRYCTLPASTKHPTCRYIRTAFTRRTCTYRII